MPQLSPEDMALLAEFEKGRRLQEVVNCVGWKDALDIAEAIVKQAEYHLMNYNGTDPAMLMALHRRARDMREFFEQLQVQIQSAIDSAKQVPQMAVTPIGVPGAQW
jgi:hypothetical protein